MKIKTQDLTDATLDWAVAKSEGRKITYDGIAYWVDDPAGCAPIGESWTAAGRRCGYSPSTDGAQGVPIIDREAICIEPLKEGDGWCATAGCTPHDFLMWDQPYSSDAAYGEGPTLLIAAMRCYVASKLGDEIDVPDELINKE